MKISIGQPEKRSSAERTSWPGDPTRCGGGFVVATEFGDHLVARYVLDLRQTVGSGRIVGAAPRLTVFRHAGDDWLVVAHANFGQIEK